MCTSANGYELKLDPNTSTLELNAIDYHPSPLRITIADLQSVSRNGISKDGTQKSGIAQYLLIALALLAIFVSGIFLGKRE